MADDGMKIITIKETEWQGGAVSVACMQVIYFGLCIVEYKVTISDYSDAVKRCCFLQTNTLPEALKLYNAIIESGTVPTIFKVKSMEEE